MNPPAAKHLRERNRLNLDTTLKTCLNAGLREIPQFPSNSIAIKAIWWPVRKEGYTVLPMWDGIPTRPIDYGAGSNTNPFGNDFTRWDRFVAIDADLDRIDFPATAEVKVRDWQASGSPLGSARTLPVVSLRRFYYRTLEPDDVRDNESVTYARLKALFDFVLDGPPEPEDKLALVGLHVATKELSDWFWLTFWWHDSPEFGEFASQRPSELSPPWRNYLMDVAISAEVPRSSTGTPKVIFNPWLEAAFAGGLNSNCLACHQRASYSTSRRDDENASQNVTPGELLLNNPFFDNRIRLDYMWSLHPTKHE